jgi:ribosomal protein S25
MQNLEHFRDYPQKQIQAKLKQVVLIEDEWYRRLNKEVYKQNIITNR